MQGPGHMDAGGAKGGPEAPGIKGSRKQLLRPQLEKHKWRGGAARSRGEAPLAGLAGLVVGVPRELRLE